MTDQIQQAQQAEAATQQEAPQTPAPTPEAPPSGDVLDKFEAPDAEQLRAQDTTKPETLVPEKPEPEPELLAGKYKTQEDLIKGYVELQKKIGDFSGAPKEYSLDDVNKDTPHQFNPDDPYLAQFKKYAREHNMSQDMFNKTLNVYRDYVVSMQPKPEKEMEKLGPDAPTKLRGLKMWSEQNLSMEGQKRLNKYMGDSIGEADLFMLLDEMRGATAPVEGPTRLEAVKSAQQSIDEIKHEIAQNFSRYESDPMYRQEKRKQLSEAFEYQKKYRGK